MQGATELKGEPVTDHATEKLKVLLVAPVPPPYGGISNWTRLLTDYVAKTDVVDLRVINIAPKRRDVDGRTVRERIFGQSRALIATLNSIRGEVARNRPHVIHLTSSGSLSLVRDVAVLSYARMRGVPTVYHLRFGRIPEIARRGTPEWRLAKVAFRLAASVLVLDLKTQDAIRRNVSRARVVLVPNLIDTSTLPAPSTGANTAVFLGWVKPAKGIEDLLVAWQDVERTHLGWVLSVVGPVQAGYLEELRDAYPLSTVDFLKDQPHDRALEILANCSVFVLPSHSEGFPNAILEAMALGKCVLGTAVGAIPEMLDEGCGVVVPPRDPKRLRDALQTVMDEPDLRQRLGRAAARKVQAQYTIERVVAAYLYEWAWLADPEVR